MIMIKMMRIVNEGQIMITAVGGNDEDEDWF